MQLLTHPYRHVLNVLLFVSIHLFEFTFPKYYTYTYVYTHTEALSTSEQKNPAYHRRNILILRKSLLHSLSLWLRTVHTRPTPDDASP